MSNARDFAILLASKFLASGNYTDAALPMDPQVVSTFMPAVTTDQYRGFADDPGFAGLSVQSVGYAETPDFERVYIYVTKASRASLRDLPREAGGVEVHTARIGKVNVRPQAAVSSSSYGNVFDVSGRIACGSSCAPAGESYSGTLGAIVSMGEELYFLSNNHVFGACNHTPVDMPIMSPSSKDAQPGRRAPSEVCRHAKILELRSGVPSLVPAATEDAAIARILDQGKVTSWQGDAATGYDTPTQTRDPSPELRIKKVGRTTGLTLGVIEAFIPSPSPLPYKMKNFTALVWFSEFWTVRAESEHFALPGDSGSLVVTEDGSAAVGLLFGYNLIGNYGLIIPIGRVLEKLGGLQLVSSFGR